MFPRYFKTTKIQFLYWIVLAFGLTRSLSGQDFDPVNLFVSGENGISEFRIPALLTTKSGILLAVCDARVDRPGDVPNNIDQVLRRSTDGGNSWTPLLTILDFVNQEGGADPQLLQDQITNRIFLFYTYCPGRNEVKFGPNRNRRHLSLQYIYSDDDGENWSIPLVVEYGLKKHGWHSMWPGPGKGLQLATGKLIVPITVADTNRMYSYFLFSNDHGDTWNISSLIGQDINEPTIIEREDGSLLVNARNKTGKRAITYSDDQGKSWSNIRFHHQLVEPSCQGSMIRLDESNILLFSNPSHPNSRKNLTIKVSMDGGRSWPLRKLIHAGPSGYSCLTILPDGNVGLLYENGDKSPYEKISFVKIPLQWLLHEEQMVVVTFGNSTTATRSNIDQVYAQRMLSDLNTNGLSCKIINAGVRGSHTGSIADNDRHKTLHALDRFETDVLTIKPDLVTLCFGLNDAWIDNVDSTAVSRIPLDKYRENLEYMVKTLKANGSIALLMTPNPIGKKFESWRYKRVENYAREVRDLAKKFEIPLLDTWNLFYSYAESRGDIIDELLLDGLHPNDLGHEVIAENLVKLIMEIYELKSR